MRFFSFGGADFGRALQGYFLRSRTAEKNRTAALHGANANYYHLDSLSHLEIGRIFDQLVQNALLRQSAKLKCKNDGRLRRSAKTKCKNEVYLHRSAKLKYKNEVPAPILPNRSGFVKCFFDLWCN